MISGIGMNEKMENRSLRHGVEATTDDLGLKMIYSGSRKDRKEKGRE